MTRARDGACRIAEINRTADVDPITLIKASCALPIVYNRTVPIGGECFSDGGVGCGLPLAYLIDELQCTHVLVILNAPLAEENEPLPWYEKAAATIACRGSFGAQYRRAFRTRVRLYDEAVQKLHTLLRGGSRARVAVVCPRSGNISRFVKHQATLHRLAEEGRSAVERFMDGAASAEDLEAARCRDRPGESQGAAPP